MWVCFFTFTSLCLTNLLVQLTIVSSKTNIYLHCKDTVKYTEIRLIERYSLG